MVVVMSSSLFTPAELEEIHAQIAQLRTDSMRIRSGAREPVTVPAIAPVSLPPFRPLVHFCQTMVYVFCVIAMVGAMMAVAIKYLL